MKHDLDGTEAGRRKLARAKEVLAEQALTVHQLAEAIHCSKVHAYRYVAILRGERAHHPRVLFIADWPLSGSGEKPRRVATYRLMETGEEVDAEKPASLTAAQRTARKVERMRTDRALNRRVNARRRQLRNINKNIQAAIDSQPIPTTFFKPQP